MATNYNITMKQFNGTDYDNLYPAANLSNSIGQIQSSQIAGGINVGNATGTLPVANGGTGLTSLTSGYYLVGNGTGQVTLQSPSQLQSSLGLDQYAKIQTGSYTGTGTYGSSNPNSLTFNTSPYFLSVEGSTGFRTFIQGTNNSFNIFFIPVTSLSEGSPVGYYAGQVTGTSDYDYFYIYKNENSVFWYVTTDASSPNATVYSAKQFNLNNLEYNYSVFLR